MGGKLPSVLPQLQGEEAAAAPPPLSLSDEKIRRTYLHQIPSEPSLYLYRYRRRWSHRILAFFQHFLALPQVRYGAELAI